MGKKRIRTRHPQMQPVQVPRTRGRTCELCPRVIYYQPGQLSRAVAAHMQHHHPATP